MKTYATKSQQDRLDRFYKEALFDLVCYLKPGSTDERKWLADTAKYRAQTKEERMTELSRPVAIDIVKRKGPEDASVQTLAQALGCKLEYQGHLCYIDGMTRTWEQAHKHLIALWRLSNDT